MANQNKSIGRFHLDGIPPSPRGVPQIEVTFDIDSNGILNVSAKDKGTGKEQNIRIEASSGLTDDEIEKMKQEAEANAESDRKAKERIDKLNSADSLIFQTEKQLKEFGDKISEDKKKPIESALSELKDAHKAEHIDTLDSKIEALNEAWKAASEDIYKAQQDQAQNAGGEQQTNPDADQQQANDDEVTDVDFEEVDDDKK